MVDTNPNKSLRTLLIIQVITLIALLLVLLWNLLPLLGLAPLGGGGGQYQTFPKSGSYISPSSRPLSFTAQGSIVLQNSPVVLAA